MRSKIFITLILSAVLVLILSACGTAGPAAVSNNNDIVQSNDDQDQDNLKLTPDIQSPQPAKAEELEEPDDQPQLQLDADLPAEFDSNDIEMGFTSSGNAYRGNPDAPVVLEEFSDFQCPFCSRFTEQTLPSLLENQIAAGEVLLVYYDFPLESIHHQAFAAANAARCAGDQGIQAYWDMHDLLYGELQQWSGRSNPDPVFIGLAEQLQLDIETFTSCVENLDHEEKVQSDIDLAQSRGVRSTPSFFLNGESLVGAQPVQVFDQAIAAVMNGESLVAEAPQGQPDGGLPLEPPRVAPTPVAVNLEDAAAELGDPNAPVTVVEYSDYQCPFCQRHVLETMPLMLSEMIETGRVRYVFKDLPLDGLHPEARGAALAARCSGDQDAYWEMHDALFETQAEWGGKGAGARDVYLSLATDLGLDEAAFTTCYDEERYAEVIEQNVQEAQSFGASATPYFFIDGFPIAGAQSFELFFYAIELAEQDLLADAFDPGEPDVANAYSVGDPDAPVTIIEYTDFQCPYCSRHFQNTYGQIKENFIDKGLVHYIFKDFPLNNIHPQAAKAAEAARCAGDQDAYLAMHEKLFSGQNDWSGQTDVGTIFSSYAAELGLDGAQFDTCLSDGVHAAAVTADLEEGAKLGINGTPAFFINGHSMSGAQPYAIFEQAINSFLEQ